MPQLLSLGSGIGRELCSGQVVPMRSFGGGQGLPALRGSLAPNLALQASPLALMGRSNLEKRGA